MKRELECSKMVKECDIGSITELLYYLKCHIIGELKMKLGEALMKTQKQVADDRASDSL